MGTVARAEPEARASEDSSPEVVSLEQIYRETLDTRSRLADAVLVDGLVGIVGGGALIVPTANDQAWRFAGINTASFGVVNTIVAGIARLGISSEQRAWESDAERAARRTPAGLARARLHAALDEHRESVAQALNLGLDCAYLGVAGTAIVASQLGVDHPNRWLASGLAIGSQSLVLIAIDLIGVMKSGGYHLRFLEGFVPSLSVAASAGGMEARLGASWGF
jgi:hypothetical protein